jgi:putative RecB family exonuclease
VSVYSHSRITSFLNCPMLYRYRYIDRIKRDVQSVEAFMGKMVHEVLQTLYDDLPRARAAGAGHYGEAFSALWRQGWTDSIRIVRDGMTAGDYQAIGRRCVESFFARHHPFEGGEVVGCEVKVEFALDPDGRYRMLGYVDRIDRAGGVLEIHDYKTGALPRAGSLERDRQLALYEIALRQRWPETTEVRHVWHYLAHDKEFVLRRAAEELDRTRMGTIRAIQRIEATTHFPARPGPLCSWCEYRDICPAWSGVRPAAALPVPPAALIDPPLLPEYEPRTGQYLLF